MSKLEPSGFLKVNSTVARRVRYGSSAYSFGGNGWLYPRATSSSSSETFSRSAAFVFDASDEPAASCDLSVAIPESSSETSACAFALYSEGTSFTSAAALPLATPCAFASAPTAFELSSRAELSWHSSRPFCSSRISFDCAGSPRRRSDSGSLFTRLPLPDGSSLASAAAMVGMNGDVGDICSGESSSSDASAAVAAERSGDAPSSIEGAAQRMGDGLARPRRTIYLRREEFPGPKTSRSSRCRTRCVGVAAVCTAELAASEPPQWKRRSI